MTAHRFSSSIAPLHILICRFLLDASHTGTRLSAARPRTMVLRRRDGTCRLLRSLSSEPLPQTAARASRLTSYREHSSNDDPIMDHAQRLAQDIRCASIAARRGAVNEEQVAGDIYYLNVAGKNVVVLNSRKAAIDLLERRSVIYSDRPRMIVAFEMITGGLLFPFGPCNDM